jgi:hypothetical protein
MLHGNVTEAAIEIRRRFSSLGGAEHIATLANMAGVIALCRQEKPKRILELGGGIGALSYAMLANSDACIDIYEDNDFCRIELEKNLSEFQGRYQIIRTYRILPPERSYDLMMIDGGNKLPFEPEWFFLRYLGHIGTVYVEGYRRSQVASASRALWAHGLLKTQKISGLVFEGKFHKGGTLLRCVPSRSLWLRTAYYLYARFREDQLFDRLYKYALRIIRNKK